MTTFLKRNNMKGGYSLICIYHQMKNKDYIKYENLRREIIQKHISIHKIAQGMGVAHRTLKNKLSGKESFNLDEALYMTRIFFPENSIYYLFEELLAE